MKTGYISLEELLDKAGGSLYKLIVGIAMRAQEIDAGSRPLVDGAVNEDKPITIAIEEARLGLVKFVSSKKKKK